jgi:hypothetical protein
MPENAIVFKFTADDQVTPVINQLKAQMAALQQQTATATKLPPPLPGGMPTGGAGGIQATAQSMGMLGSMMERMLIRFALFQVGIKGVEFAFTEAQKAIQAYTQTTALLDRSNEKAAGTFVELASAAMSTGQSIEEVSKRMATLYKAGIPEQEAIDAAAMIGRTFKQTGIDLSEAYAKAQTFGAGPKEALEVGIATHDAELRDRALLQLRKENLRQYDDLVRQSQDREQREALADYKRINDYRIEDQTRAIEHELRDHHRAVEQEMADRHEAAQRAMEENHRVAREQMEDQHRVAEQAEADQHRLRDERTSIAAGMKGLEEAAASQVLGVPLTSGLA